MFASCIFCNAKLGANDAIEHFPIGRRLAFDAAKGRLWVVCRACERWNLTPIEERWEAIEDCERLFSETRARVSTEHIGLARARQGLTLIRIGAPQRPEMAAWRYGDQFGKRRRRHLVLAGAGVAAVGTMMILPMALGVGTVGSASFLFNVSRAVYERYQVKRVRTRLRIEGAPVGLVLRRQHLDKATLRPHGSTWALRVPFDQERDLSDAELRATPEVLLPPGIQEGSNPEELDFIVDAGLRAAARLFPAVNAGGASRDQVESAVQHLEETPDPSALFRRIATRHRGETGSRLGGLPHHVCLALEMAAHEDIERRLLEGELTELEAAWRSAEEVAAIADAMFLPDGTDAAVAAMKREADEANEPAG